VLRLSRFRTTLPAFDAVLRRTVLPGIRASTGALGVLAGRQGPDELGTRILASVWSSEAAMRDALGDRSEVAEVEPIEATADHSIELVTVWEFELALAPLSTGILRIARGRIGASDPPATSIQRLASDLGALRAEGAGPHDLIIAEPGPHAFLMVSTWGDWSAIERATGASIDGPLQPKRMAALEAFQADHFELLSDAVA
jgi:hypothetical protein